MDLENWNILNIIENIKELFIMDVDMEEVKNIFQMELFMMGNLEEIKCKEKLLFILVMDQDMKEKCFKIKFMALEKWFIQMGKYYKQIGQKMKNMEEQKYNGKMVGLKLLIINIIKLKKVIQLNLNGNKVEGFQD